MNLWRLEVARLLRTNRWMILFGVFGLFGVLGPVTARYLGEIIARFGGDIEIVVPDPQPVDGLAQFVSNASQVGILAVVVVSAAALAIDARPEVSSFYRTRVSGAWALVVPRFVVNLAAAVTAMVVGTVLAVVGSVMLIGSLDIGGVALGTVLLAVYLGFLLAVVAAVAAATRSTVSTVFVSLTAAILLPIVGLVAAVKPWLPSELVVAPLVLASNGDAVDFLPALAASVAAGIGLLVAAVRSIAAREL